MRSKSRIVVLVVLMALLAVYLWPVPRVPFDVVYSDVDPAVLASLRSFRAAHPPRVINVDGVKWEYAAFGEGGDVILFLHGMTGAYDIWWRVMEALQSEYRVISVTYPAVDTLDEMSAGALAVLDAEGVGKANIVGTSLGGYFAQYLVATHPERVSRAVFANTFPPNDLIKEKNGTIGALIPWLPEWLVIDVLRGSFVEAIYPTSGNDELTLAFLMELSYGRVSRAQVAGRYHCVVEKFDAPDPDALGIPVMIVETDNDPLVEEALRQQLKETYPSAVVHTLSVGHFPYLKLYQEYAQFLGDFFIQ